MTLPVWPVGLKDQPMVDSWTNPDPYLDPLSTDMEGGNVRLRTRPGDDVQTFQFSLLFSLTEYATFRTFVLTTLNRGTSRFTMRVWTGSAFETKTVQFNKKPIPTSVPPKMQVAMDIRVFPA